MLSEEELKILNDLTIKEKTERLQNFQSELQELLKKYNVNLTSQIQVVSN